jgi:hypothetical protein
MGKPWAVKGDGLRAERTHLGPQNRLLIPVRQRMMLR